MVCIALQFFLKGILLLRSRLGVSLWIWAGLLGASVYVLFIWRYGRQFCSFSSLCICYLLLLARISISRLLRADAFVVSVPELGIRLIGPVTLVLLILASLDQPRIDFNPLFGARLWPLLHFLRSIEFELQTCSSLSLLQISTWIVNAHFWQN